MGEISLSNSQIDHQHFHRHQFVSNGSDRSHRNHLLPHISLTNIAKFFLSISRIEWRLHRNRFVSDGSDRFHRKHFIALHPRWALFQSLPRIVMTFPSESTTLRWNRWIPSERLHTPLCNMKSPTNRHELFRRNRIVSDGSPPLVGLYTCTLPVFR